MTYIQHSETDSLYLIPPGGSGQPVSWTRALTRDLNSIHILMVGETHASTVRNRAIFFMALWYRKNSISTYLV